MIGITLSTLSNVKPQNPKKVPKRLNSKIAASSLRRAGSQQRHTPAVNGLSSSMIVKHHLPV